MSSYHPLKPIRYSACFGKRTIKIYAKRPTIRICCPFSLFVASFFAIPVSLMAVIGSLVLLGWRWAYLKIPPGDMLKKTPWYIIVFAFSMYVIIYGLNNIGLTDWLINLCVRWFLEACSMQV